VTQIALFLLIVFGITWTLCLVLWSAATQGGVAVLFAWLLPTVWSPTIVALILTRWSGGAAAVRREMTRLRYRPGTGRWLVIAAILPAFTIVIATLIARAAGEGAPFTRSAAIPIVLFMQFITGALGEELGWRGFLLPRLGVRYGSIMAVLWSLWHVAGMVFPGMALQLVPPVLNLTFVVFFGVFLAFLFNRTGESVLPTMVAHLSLNIALAAGGVRLSSPVFWGAMVGMTGALAIFTVVASSGRRAIGPGVLVEPAD
jgi:uncharacterized protein